MAPARESGTVRDVVERPSAPASALTSSAPLAGVPSLQRSVGNAAVARLLQRQDTETDEAPARTELDPETGALVDELFGVRPHVDSFEAVVGGETEQGSRGELTEEAGRLWRREHLEFADAFRAAADRRGAGSDPVQARSPEGEEQQFSQRWGLVIAQYGGVPELAQVLARGSPFDRALRGSFTRIVPSGRNPTADQMSERITGAIQALWQAMGPTEVAELVVNFQGHGDDGGLWGARSTYLDRTALAGYGRMAADFGIHLVYVIDACDVGALVGEAQAERLQDRTGSGGSETARALSEIGRSLREQLRAIAMDREVEAADAARPIFDRLEATADQITASGQHTAEAERLQTALLVTRTYFYALLTASRGELLERASIRILLDSSARLLDAINDMVGLLVSETEGGEGGGP